MRGMETPWTSSRTVTGDGLDLAVFEASVDAAPTVVLVHGYPDTHAVWDGVADALSDRFHVVAYDVRGAGASGAPAAREGYDLEHLVGDLAAVLDAVSPDEPVHLVAHDWGSIQSWEAVTCGRLDGRIATYTSMSGPSLDHVAHWMRARRTRRWRDLRALLGQGLHSWYIAFFQTPRLPELVWRTTARRGFPRYLRRVEGIAEDRLPGPTLARDGAQGVELYRQNVRRRMADPQPRTTDIPVQVIVPTGDRFVTPALLDDIVDHAPNTIRRDVAGGHWNNVSDPERFAGWVTEFVDANG